MVDITFANAVQLKVLREALGFKYRQQYSSCTGDYFSITFIGLGNRDSELASKVTKALSIEHNGTPIKFEITNKTVGTLKIKTTEG